MALKQVEIGHTYEMEDGRVLYVHTLFTSPASRTWIRFDVIRGQRRGYIDLSYEEFLAQAVRQGVLRSAGTVVSTLLRASTSSKLAAFGSGAAGAAKYSVCSVTS